MTIATMEGGALPMPPDLEVAITSQSWAAEPKFVQKVEGTGSPGLLSHPNVGHDI